MVREVLSGPALQARRRAVVKTLCYRLFMLLITVTVAWMVVGDVSDALNIGLVTNVAKTGTYYLYERTWDHIAWGVSNPLERRRWTSVRYQWWTSPGRSPRARDVWRFDSSECVGDSVHFDSGSIGLNRSSCE